MMRTSLQLVVVVVAVSFALVAGETERSPFDMALQDDRILISDRSAQVAYLLAGPGGSPTSIALRGSGSGVAWAAGGRGFIAEYDAGSIAEIDARGRIQRRLACGPKPVGLAVHGQTLAVADYGLHQVRLIDLAQGETKQVIAVARHPWFLAASPSEAVLAVGHLIPELAATDARSAASVSLIDLRAGTVRAQVRLPYGSSNVRELRCSLDGRWCYVVHTIGRVALPTTMLERGWINTNAISIIDLRQDQLHASLLLDQVTRGAPDPWGIDLDAEGTVAWISLAGTSELLRLDLAGLHGLLDGSRQPPPADAYAGSSGAIWAAVQADPTARERLSYHLSALYGAGLIRRLELDLPGARAVRVLPDGSVLVAGYYAGALLHLDPAGGQRRLIELGPQPQPDAARRGEMLFHDARGTFQHWLSCASCHPDARADGLNWDLGNDGIGNSKNAKSLLYSAHTPPAMSTGIREGFEVAVAAGMRFQMQPADPQCHEDLMHYLASMQAESSPYLVDGELSPAAQRGKALFHQAAVGCGNCHSGDYFTDLQRHDVGTRGPRDRVDAFDTPTLCELWRSGPYLHDGRAVDLASVLREHNAGDRHGRTSQLSAQELTDLVAFLRSL